LISSFLKEPQDRPGVLRERILEIVIPRAAELTRGRRIPVQVRGGGCRVLSAKGRES